MNKVLIVDDDFSFCIFLKTLIDWEENGFHICGTAADGQTATKLLKTKRPDIIMTDISMPVMDGISLITYIEQNCPATKVVAMSAYDNFEYVRQSLKNGAIDYLLKNSLDRKALLDVLAAARKDILAERYSSNNYLDYTNTANMEMYLQAYLSEVFNGFVSGRDEITRGLDSIGFNTREWCRFAIAVVEIDDFWMLQERLKQEEYMTVIRTFMEITRQVLIHPQKVIVSHINGGRFFILFGFGTTSERNITMCLDSSANLVRKYAKMQLNITVSLGISRIFGDICSIASCFADASALLKSKFFKGKDNIIKNGIGAFREEDFSCLDIKDEKELLSCIRNIDEVKTLHNIAKIFERISEAGIGYKSIQMICIDLINIINKIAKENGIQVSHIFSCENIPYEELNKFETLDDIKNWMIDIYTKAVFMLKSVNTRRNCKEYTKRAIEYINDNYSRDISLHDAAGHIGINSEYLSRIFKDDMGKGFSEYLTSVRIEHAKRMIKDRNRKLKDIISDVGFNNYNYFFKVFKTMVNMTPQEYEDASGS